MIHDVLVAYDSSPSSNRALLYAADLAQRTGATIHVTYVQEVSLGPFVRGDPTPAAGEEERMEKIRERLKEACRAAMSARALDLSDDAFRFHVERSRSAASSLEDYARETGVDLIMMGTQGHRGIKRAVVGSVAREMLRTAPCPVFTTRVHEDEDLTRETTVERVVVPIDFSEPSKRALSYAGQFASVYGAPMKLVHVIEALHLPSIYELESPDVSNQKVKERAKRTLEEWGTEVRASGHPVTYEVRSGDSAPYIVDAASARTDLLVMATRGRSGLRRTVLGSVTEEVVCEAHGPVLATRIISEEP